MQRVLTVREKAILYVTIGIIAGSFLFNMFIGPVLRRYDTLNKEISITRIKLEKYLRLLSQKDSIQSRFNNLAMQTDLSGEQKDPLVGMLAELEKLASNANIKITDIRPQTSGSSTSAYRELVVDIRAEGPMEGFVRFIYDLENSLALLRIKRLQFSAKPNAQELEGSFSISEISAKD